MATSTEIRKQFLDFFKSKGHKIVPSASVIPYEDPTLLFTNAGMNQFKDVFLGTGRREYTRCADTQKCIRVSGKHNDLEEVGHDGSHHTFFEMLGNWSFGDYHKKEAIGWAWELLTEVWKLDKKRLWATVYRDDDESFDLWKSETDIDPAHVLKFDEKDNFWEMGDTGPCGPCSEIHYDSTAEANDPALVNSGDPHVVEIWNLVFIQYNRDSAGKLHDLPAKHVDTGMGFERMVSVLQKKKSNYETDVFLPLINELINLTGKEYSGDKFQSAMNVVADHVRTLTFAIADGAIPSNEGRGYVLRRILRRAARYGRNLGMHKPFIYKLVDVLVPQMGSVFPEIIDKQNFIKEVIEGEEEGFNETLDRGLVFFNEEISKMKRSDGVSVGAFERTPVSGTATSRQVFSGSVAFKLHDTYGFPVDLTQLMAREIGYEVDVNKFNELMSEQKERARSAREDIAHDTDKGFDTKSYLENRNPYDPYNADENGIRTKIIHIQEKLGNGHSVCVLNNNPFYSESGGQVSDKGVLILEDKEIKVIDSEKDYVIVEGKFDNAFVMNDVVAKIDFPRRLSIQRNHSATHIVHEALRRVLGPHVKQMGSYLDDYFLRFDFPHFHKLKDEEITAIEEMVNDKIHENISVQTRLMKKDEASREYPNLRMFFGEKYGDEVRVVIIDDKYSVELCGGTHVKSTDDIGLFKIVKEESISSGTRRIFARTGEGIIRFMNERVQEIDKIVNELPEKYSPDIEANLNSLKNELKIAGFRDALLLHKLLNSQDAVVSSINELKEKYLEEKKQAEKLLAKGKIKKAIESLDALVSTAEKFEDVNIIKAKFDADSMDELRDIGDALRGKLKRGVGLIYSEIDNKVSLCAVVTDDLIKERSLSAGKIAGDVAKILGGGGGGRPQLATAGGKDVSKINEALAALPTIIKKYLK